MGKSKEAEDLILGEQIHHAVSQLPTVQTTSFIIALVLAFTVRTIIPKSDIIIWLLMILGIILSRLALHHRFMEADEKSFSPKRWTNIYLFLTFLSGIAWGLSAFILFPIGHTWSMAFFLIILAGLSAGVTISHASLKWGAMSWLVPVMLLYAARCAMEGQQSAYTLGFLIVLFMVAMARLSLKNNDAITSAMLLKFENIDLLAAERESEERFRTLAGASFEGIIMSLDGVIKDCNDQMSNMLGYDKEELIGKPVTELLPPDIVERVMDNIRNGREVIIDHDLLCKDGNRRSVEAHGKTTSYHGKEYRITAVHDITDRKKAIDELKRLNELLACEAATDQLTGIANQSKFNETLSTEILRSRRFKLPLSLIIFDIDQFKQINDTYGHATGDSVLQFLAGLVAKSVRRHDLFARWGGEEFLIMVTNTGLHGAEIYAERLRVLIENFDFPEAVHLTCSFGVTEFAPEDTVEVLTRRADEALYQAKARGRNRVDSIPGVAKRAVMD